VKENPAAGEGPRLLSMDRRRRIYLLLRRAGALAGLDVVRRGIYSPIPDVWDLPEEAWSARASMVGVDLDLDGQVALLEGPLASYIRAFEEEPGGDGFTLANGLYGGGVAEVLYAMVRHARPKRILELGSGYSSLVIARALARNRADGSPVRHLVCDPYPSTLLDGRPGEFEVERVAAERVPLGRFEELEADDILFVDTSHTVKVGGDVNRIVLEGLPRLRPGVLAHFHDIFLPYEYPPSLVRDGGLFWQEQYLLHAFLAFNPAFEVVLAMAALRRQRETELLAALPSLDSPESLPSAFWLRRRA
jgi:hypothetical protein